MNDIIQIKNVSYARYEELLIKRDNLKKSAFQLERRYIRTFGERIIKVFEVKIECICKKKAISFYQAAINQGKAVNQDELKAYLDAEMSSYKAKLEDMIKDNESSKLSQKVSDRVYLKIKRIYRKLAKVLHPDINPKTSQVDELRDLWERITIAYKCNELKDLEELEMLASSALESIDKNRFISDIINIDEKISAVESEIDTIKNTEPYQYKYLFDDETAVEEMNKELDDEYNSYKEYETQLDDIILELMGKGMTLIWKKN